MVAGDDHTRDWGETIQVGAGCGKLLRLCPLGKITTNNNNIRIPLSHRAQQGLTYFWDIRWAKVEVRNMQQIQHGSPLRGPLEYTPCAVCEIPAKRWIDEAA
jgi:hypothetical protein